MDSQIIIKVILSLAAVVVGLGIAWPGRGARRLAIRRLAVILVVGLAVLAIAVPSLTNRVASLVGIGRGADLLLYGLTIGFGFYAVGVRREMRVVHAQILALARAHAISQAPRHGSAEQAETPMQAIAPDENRVAR